MSFELADEELAGLLAEEFDFSIPSIENLEAASAAALTPPSLAYLARGTKRKRKSSRNKRSVRRRFDQPNNNMVRLSVVRRPSSRAPYRSRTRARYARRRYRRPNYRRSRPKARINRSMIGSSGNTMNQIRVVKRLQEPKGVVSNSSNLKNLKILDFDQPDPSNAAYAFHYEFTLNDLYGDDALKAIYQYYKILGVKLIFYPLQNAHPGMSQSNSTNPVRAIDSAATITTGSAPRIILAKDLSSVTNFSNENDALAHDDAKLHVFNDGNEFSYYCSPRPLDVVGREGVISSNAPGKQQWLSTDASGAAIGHRGVRCWAANMHSAIQIKVLWEFSIAFRGLKA